MTSEEVDWRRLFVKVGASMVYNVGAPGLFAMRWGWEGVVTYIIILALVRWIMSEIVASIVTLFPIGIEIYRFSPMAIIIGASLPIIAPDSAVALLLIPALVGCYVSGYWTQHFEIGEVKGTTVDEFQFTETLGAVISAVLVVFVAWLHSIEYAVALGGAIAFFSFFLPVGVSNDKLQANLDMLREQAANRTTEEIRNGIMLVCSVATVTFCSLSYLRLYVFKDPDSAVSGVISLGLVLALAEGLSWFVKRRVSDDNKVLRNCGFLLTTAGFLLMFFEALGLFWLGYIGVTTVSRAVNRSSDRRYGRAALKGVGRRPGLREITRYRMMAFCTPLLLWPSILPVVGIFAAVILVLIDFKLPKS